MVYVEEEEVWMGMRQYQPRCQTEPSRCVFKGTPIVDDRPWLLQLS